LRIHLIAATIGIILAVILVLTLGSNVTAFAPEMCCSTMGDCPGTLKCCEANSNEPTCSGEREGYCRATCGNQPW
jgi:hypothetical protein